MKRARTQLKLRHGCYMKACLNHTCSHVTKCLKGGALRMNVCFFKQLYSCLLCDVMHKLKAHAFLFVGQEL